MRRTSTDRTKRTLILLFGVDMRLASSLSLAISLPTMLVGFACYSADQSFAVIGRNRTFLLVMAAGSLAGAFIGGLHFGIVPEVVLLPALAVILFPIRSTSFGRPAILCAAAPRRGPKSCACSSAARRRRRDVRARLRVRTRRGWLYPRHVERGRELALELRGCDVDRNYVVVHAAIARSRGRLADADHVIGFLALTTTSIAAAEVARPARYFNVLLGAALIAAPFVAGADSATVAVRFVLGATLIALSFRRGSLRAGYGAWSRYIA